MNQFINSIFPLFDYLYIFQLFEYEDKPFFIWFIKYFHKRNLQRKQKLIFTKKIIILLLLTLVQIFLISFFILLKTNILIALISFLLLQNLSPVFIIFSKLIFSPLENYSRTKTINIASEKIAKSKNLTTIAIIGSFAKTSIKNILYTLLWKDFYVVKTPKSFNTQLSIARTIISGVKETTQVFIVEMDAYYPDDIKKLCSIAKPSLGIITAIAPQHLERFNNMEELAKAQFEVTEFLDKGTLFVNSNDEWSKKLENQYDVKKIFYGDKTNDFYITDIQQKLDGLEFFFYAKNGSVKIMLSLQGTHHAYNFLAAATIAHSLGLPLKTIQQRAALILPTEHRLEIKKMGQITIIDNSYNANVTSAKSSFKLLKDYPGQQKIILTPGLIELGGKSKETHLEFAQNAANSADAIIIVGETNKEYILEGLKNASYPTEKIHLLKSTQDALDYLPKITIPGAVVLLENDLPDQYF